MPSNDSASQSVEQTTIVAETTGTKLPLTPTTCEEYPPVPTQPGLVAFISGPLQANTTYFNAHYAPRVLQAISAGHKFVVGPARGVDTIAFDFLRTVQRVPAQRIRIYMNSTQAANPRFRHSAKFSTFEKAGGQVVVVQGGHTDKDAAMTRDSHYDILRYRPEDECRALFGSKYWKRVSGTEKNEIRRKMGFGRKISNVVDIDQPVADLP